jgi:hypothetical protein
MSSPYIERVVKEALIRRNGRQGRLAKTEEARRRELDAAGRARQDHPTAFSYPRGHLAKVSEEERINESIRCCEKIAEVIFNSV